MRRSSPGILAALATLIVVGWLQAVLDPVGAICGSPRHFYSWRYIYTPGVDIGSGINGSSVTDDFEAAFWALGFGDPEFRRGIDSGAMPWFADSAEGTLEGWVLIDPNYAASFGGQWAQSQLIDGCVSAAGSTSSLDGDECMVILFSDQHEGGGYFTLLAELPDDTFNWVFTPYDTEDYELVPIPVPRVESIQYSATHTLKLAIAPPDVPGGLHLSPGCLRQGDLVVGYRVYEQRLEPGEHPAADRRRDAGWFGGAGRGECGEALFSGFGESVEIEVTCDSDTDVYLAHSLVFDSGFETPFVSAESRSIPCRVCPGGSDKDGDGFCATTVGSAPADCDDGNAAVYPGAPQKCDGINNDCLDAAWPGVPPVEMDVDGDGFAACDKTIVLELPADNCPGVPNPGQADSDGDGIGDACDPDPGAGRECRDEACRN